MEMTFSESGKKLRKGSFEALEKKYGIHLPEDYKAFLMKTNGGYVDDFYAVPDFPEKNPVTGEETMQGTNLEYVFPLEIVDKQIQVVLDETVIPKSFVPIAFNGFGSVISIDINPGVGYGNVYFSNHELWDPDTGLWISTKIADSFTNFMNSLTLCDD